jgi:hypothetical protein
MREERTERKEGKNRGDCFWTREGSFETERGGKF